MKISTFTSKNAFLLERICGRIHERYPVGNVTHWVGFTHDTGIHEAAGEWVSWVSWVSLPTKCHHTGIHERPSWVSLPNTGIHETTYPDLVGNVTHLSWVTLYPSTEQESQWVTWVTRRYDHF